MAHKLEGLGANDSVGTAYQPDTNCFVSIDDYGQRASRGADGGPCGGVTPGSSINLQDNGFHRVKQVPGEAPPR
ncbi:hypothetical protein ACN28S_29570 [Cystobacter fuscus]